MGFRMKLKPSQISFWLSKVSVGNNLEQIPEKILTLKIPRSPRNELETQRSLKDKESQYTE